MLTACGKTKEINTTQSNLNNEMTKPAESEFQSQTNVNVISTKAEPSYPDFVNIQEYIPNAVIDLKYSTTDNFTGTVIYQFKTAYLRYGTTLKLINVAKQLEQLGYRIKIWDAYRPFVAQIALWNAYPDGNYVANPAKGYTSHNLGNTVDISIVKLNGDEVNMPTGFDDFTAKSNRDYSDITLEQAQNSTLLESIMIQFGFKGYSNEWWHYEDLETYSPDENFIPPNN